MTYSNNGYSGLVSSQAMSSVPHFTVFIATTIFITRAWLLQIICHDNKLFSFTELGIYLVKSWWVQNLYVDRLPHKRVKQSDSWHAQWAGTFNWWLAPLQGSRVHRGWCILWVSKGNSSSSGVSGYPPTGARGPGDLPRTGVGEDRANQCFGTRSRKKSGKLTSMEGKCKLLVT